MDVDQIGAGIEFIVPDGLINHRSRQELAGIAEEIFQQAEFALGDIEDAIVACDAPVQQIHADGADAEDRLQRLAARPADQRFDARHQLDQGERLDQIIVAAGAQAADAVVDFAECADHQHRRTVTPGA